MEFRFTTNIRDAHSTNRCEGTADIIWSLPDVPKGSRTGWERMKFEANKGCDERFMICYVDSRHRTVFLAKIKKGKFS